MHRLTPSFRTKIWGSLDLQPWYPTPKERTGEVWFVDQHELPLLVKFIFTTDRLSVQVHPGDDYAREHENCSGKTEMWHVLRAAPGATIGVGLRERLTSNELREASLSGAIEHLLIWHEVAPGDTFLIPAGTIHALGAGVVLCEIQQQSDVTYRLYDYGRPRELHLDRAIEVARPEPYTGKTNPPAPVDGSVCLTCCRYFTTHLVCAKNSIVLSSRHAGCRLLIVIEGCGRVNGETLRAGETWRLAPASEVRIDPAEPMRLLETWTPK